MFSVIKKSSLYSSIVVRNMLSFKNKNRSPEYAGHLIQIRGDATGDVVCKPLVRGIDYIRNPRLNKGLAFSLEERQFLGIHGLMAPSFKTQQEQVEICKMSIDRYKNDLNKYLFLAELLDINERLFYKVLSTDIEKYMPIVYTPTVGLACQKFGIAYRRPRGLYININDKGHILDILKNWPEPDVRAICFTDGERILGLGDLGAYGMGIPIGKLSLYTALAGIKPNRCLPILLDVGTDNQKLHVDPLYIGLRKKRTRGAEYDDFLEEFMQACVKRYGTSTLLQFEDFALVNATPLLEKYRDSYCTFNDDIQGTASVAVAGLMAATRITKKKMSENTYLFLGAGSAAAGIGNLIVDAMKEEGLAENDARGRVYMFDIDGVVTSKRSKGVPYQARNFAKDVPEEKNFEKFVGDVKPTALIGCSTVGGAFTANILKQMAKNTERPIIFALSNPTSKAECSAQQAYDNTEGRCVFASGSPFPPVQYGGKTYYTGQGNNSYIFPGIALGVIASGSYLIPEKMFLTAARSVANFVAKQDLEVGRIYPPLADIRKVSEKISVEIAEMAYTMKIATRYPKPADLSSFILSTLYDLNYPSNVPAVYTYPAATKVTLKTVNEMYPTGKGRYYGRYSTRDSNIKTLF